MAEKRCLKCGESKSLGEFYRSSRIKDGYENGCKQCRRERVNEKDFAPRTEGDKICPRCGEARSVAEFNRNKQMSDGLASWCKRCCVQHAKQWVDENREYYLASQKKWHHQHREKQNLKRAERRKGVWKKAIEAYGGAHCSWPGCTETRLDCLSLDHVSQDGAEQRRKGEASQDGLYRQLKENDWPPGFRVLCRNHNWKAWLEHRKKTHSQTYNAIRCRKSDQENRLEALKIYGKGTVACAICGKMDIDVLTLDHTLGGGCKHRREMGYSSLHRYLRRNGYPHGYRVLCRNCNWIEGRKNGVTADSDRR